MLREGALDDRVVDVEVAPLSTNKGNNGNVVMDSSSNPNFVVGEIFKIARGGGGKRTEKKKMTIAAARPILTENESGMGYQYKCRTVVDYHFVYRAFTRRL